MKNYSYKVSGTDGQEYLRVEYANGFSVVYDYNTRRTAEWFQGRRIPPITKSVDWDQLLFEGFVDLESFLNNKTS